MIQWSLLVRRLWLRRYYKFGNSCKPYPMETKIPDYGSVGAAMYYDPAEKSSSPFTLMFIFPAAIGYVLAQRLYLPASRDLNRLIAVTRSPILTIFTEALAGSAFIRASALRKHLQRESELRMGAALRPTFALYHVNETSAILNDVIGAVVVAAVIFLT
eukprot:gene16297-19339_t